MIRTLTFSFVALAFVSFWGSAPKAEKGDKELRPFIVTTIVYAGSGKEALKRAFKASSASTVSPISSSDPRLLSQVPARWWDATTFDAEACVPEDDMLDCHSTVYRASK